MIGVADADRGEVPKAFVVFNNESVSTIDESRERKVASIHNFIHCKLILDRFSAQPINFLARTVSSPHKRIQGGIVVVSALPKTVTGKISKAKLRAELASDQTEIIL